MSSINFKRLSKAFLLEMIRHSNVMDEFVAENMTLPELRAHLDSLTESHGSELEKAKQTVDEMIAQGAVLKTKRGRPPKRSSKKSTASDSKLKKDVKADKVEAKSKKSEQSGAKKEKTSDSIKKRTESKKKSNEPKERAKPQSTEKDSLQQDETGEIRETSSQLELEPTEERGHVETKIDEAENVVEANTETAKTDQIVSDHKSDHEFTEKSTVDEIDFDDIPEPDEQRFRSVRRTESTTEKEKLSEQDRDDESKDDPGDDSDKSEEKATRKKDDERKKERRDGKHTRRSDKIDRHSDKSDRNAEKSSRQDEKSEKQDDDCEDKSKKNEEKQEIFSGILELMPDGYGFLRTENYIQSNNDIYVSPQFIRRFNLRQGDHITGPCRHRRDSDRYQALSYVSSVNGLAADQVVRRPNFERLTPIYPNERFVLETAKTEFSTRIIDLVAPIGKGQRGMIVSPPKAGKTILLQKIANAISIKTPEAHLIVLLIDERPEEVTDMQRSIKGEVVYSTFDKTPENHVRISELVLERAMRMVELGQDVVILLDSITRLARAYNLTINPTGRTLSGGLDPGALNGPKRFFGAARNIEKGGSLTIVATSLVETGSRMDEVIFEEFKGTGNMEVYLDRKLSEKRIFPAIDIVRSGTRREDLLLSKDELDAVWAMRKAFGNMEPAAVTEMILGLLMKTNNNHHFVSSINVSLNDRTLHETMNPKRQLGGQIASV